MALKRWIPILFRSGCTEHLGNIYSNFKGLEAMTVHNLSVTLLQSYAIHPRISSESDIQPT